MPPDTPLSFGSSPAAARILEESAQYARTPYPLLLLGAPGSGKTVLARHIHNLSGRPGAFVRESAAAVPEHLEHGHLGGHARGSFTGAHQDRMGLLESAHRGTFFLDELGVASATVQQILLHLLDEGTLRRVGEVRARPVDVRFIAATNADLEEMVLQGAFRRDLRDRFGYLVLWLPTLAERRDEILPLAERCLRREAAAVELDFVPELGPRARDCLLVAPWHGNIRELESVCRFAVLHAEPGQAIDLDQLPPDFVAQLGDLVRVECDRTAAERAQEVLRQARGNKSAAARLLGVSRQHFYRLLAATGTAMILSEVCNLSGWTLQSIL